MLPVYKDNDLQYMIHLVSQSKLWWWWWWLRWWYCDDGNDIDDDYNNEEDDDYDYNNSGVVHV